MPNRARIVVGRDSRIALVNKHAEKLLGARAQDILGLRDEDLVVERHRARYVEERERYLAEPWSAKPAFGFYVTLVDRSGRELPLFAVPEPIASEDGLWVSISLYPREERGDVPLYAALARAPAEPARL